MPASPTSRRAVLRLLAGGTGVLAGGAVLTGALTGCSLADPTVRATRPPVSPPAPPAPPPPPAGLADAVRAESLALAWCRAIHARRYDLPAGHLRNLATAAAVHQRHLVALALPSPQTRPGAAAGSGSGSPSAPAPSPSPTAPSTLVASPTLPTVSLPGTPAAAFKGLGTALGTVRAGHLDRADAADGPVALLWASLAAAAGQTTVIARRSDAVPRPASEPDHPPYRAMTLPAAAQALLGQLHAMVFGYQVALAPIPGDDAGPYRDRLTDLRHHRDTLATVLEDRGMTVPAAEPEYDTGGPITSPRAAVAMVARMESALLPHLGNWVAATDAEHRRAATRWLVTATTTAVAAGARPTPWPGWPD